MRKKISKSLVLLGLAVAVCILCAAIIGTRALTLGELKKQLVSEAKTLASLTANEENSAEFLSKGEYLQRVTLIGADGSVLMDNESAASNMENHLEREEIASAIKTGEGWASRFSVTRGEEYLYYAMRLPDGSVLRVAGARSSELAVGRQMLLYLVLGAALAVILSVVISRFLTRSLMKPINAIDLDDPLSGDAYEELAPMLGRMEKQNKRIKAQIDAMRSQRTELDAIISEMQEGLLVLDKKRKVLSANARAREILGLEENYSDKTLPEMCRDAELLRLIHSAGGESRYGEITANGRVYRVCAGKAGSEGGLVVLMEDITDEKNAEESRRQFTANVSHELRTPLTTISGYSEIIEAGLAPQGDIAALGGKVHSESLRMLSLIEDIIHLSAIDEGAKAPDFGKQDLLSVAVESVEKLRELSESKQVTLSVDGSSAYVMGSRVQLMELARNLIENGVKYNRENGHVWVSVLAEGRRAVISVRDDGIGIPPEDKPRVFERFYRVDKSRSKATGGTGLGLSIVKHIAQSHGADIRLTSALGKGTEIVVSFPICAN